jgi:hypothetical protein
MPQGALNTYIEPVFYPFTRCCLHGVMRLPIYSKHQFPNLSRPWTIFWPQLSRQLHPNFYSRLKLYFIFPYRSMASTMLWGFHPDRFHQASVRWDVGLPPGRDASVASGSRAGNNELAILTNSQNDSRGSTITWMRNIPT